MKAEHLLGLMVLIFAGIVLLSGRPFLPANTPRISEIHSLPEEPKFADVRDFTHYGSGILPYNARERAERSRRNWNERQPIKVGYAFREVSMMRLPLAAYRDLGLVTYVETGAGYKIAILGPEQVELLEELTGRDYDGYFFPFWRYSWGWLVVFGFLSVLGLQYREHRKYLEANGWV